MLKDGFAATSALDSGSGTPATFAEVDLSEGAWYDYDERAAAPVSVSECATQIVRA